MELSKINSHHKLTPICHDISLELMYLGLGKNSIIQGADPADEAEPSTVVDEKFNIELDELLRKED